MKTFWKLIVLSGPYLLLTLIPVLVLWFLRWLLEIDLKLLDLKFEYIVYSSFALCILFVSVGYYQFKPYFQTETISMEIVYVFSLVMTICSQTYFTYGNYKVNLIETIDEITLPKYKGEIYFEVIKRPEFKDICYQDHAKYKGGGRGYNMKFIFLMSCSLSQNIWMTATFHDEESNSKRVEENYAKFLIESEGRAIKKVVYLPYKFELLRNSIARDYHFDLMERNGYLVQNQYFVRAYSKDLGALVAKVIGLISLVVLFVLMIRLAQDHLSAIDKR